MEERAFFLSAPSILDKLSAIFIGPVGGVDPAPIEDKVVDSLSYRPATRIATQAA